jgi:hypothetical protein
MVKVSPSTDIIGDFVELYLEFRNILGDLLYAVANYNIAQYLGKDDKEYARLMSAIMHITDIVPEIARYQERLGHYFRPEKDNKNIVQTERLLTIADGRQGSIEAFRVIYRKLQMPLDSVDPKCIEVLEESYDSSFRLINDLLWRIHSALANTAVAKNRKDWVSYYGLDEITRGDIEVK